MSQNSNFLDNPSFLVGKPPPEVTFHPSLEPQTHQTQQINTPKGHVSISVNFSRKSLISRTFKCTQSEFNNKIFILLSIYSYPILYKLTIFLNLEPLKFPHG